MDRLIYLSMAGARHALEAQATVSHNLANVNTSGFRAQINAFRAVPVFGDGQPTRAFVVDSSVGTDFRPGTLQQTGRDLDVAVLSRGFIAVQLPDGSEAYTRNGSFNVGPGGVLETRQGQPVMGDGGPITVPPDSTVAIARDGTVSVLPTAGRSAVNVIGRIKLVNPEPTQLERRADGLFRMKDGTAATADAAVAVVQGSLEGSNVNAVEAMVQLISHARAFEMHTKMLQNAEANDRQAMQILSMNR
ncbi:MAG: flagellar basal-body rod protein FlgF [Gammaproteobacteria bacterium]|nr:flagellar basal-body rod protein FlgF [Gammaproteobacteria bacterium]